MLPLANTKMLRTLRLGEPTGTSSIDQVNSGYTDAHILFDNTVLYPNPYLVVTPKGYTKHYYADTERLATTIGTGGFSSLEQTIDQNRSQREDDLISSFYTYYQNKDPFLYDGNLSEPLKTIDIDKNQREEIEYHCKPVFLATLDLLTQKDILLNSIAAHTQNNGTEQEIFYYHGDHLGSAHWVTDFSGVPVQYIHYAPYGELISSQAIAGYDERYKFTGKERDEESGYDYFGARFYSSPLSFWLSVDPLTGKYPNISPYAYCAWNPVKYTDPDGKQVGIKGTITNDDGTISIATFYYGEVEGIKGFYCDGQHLETDFANKAVESIGMIQNGGKCGNMLVNAVVNDDRTIILYQNRLRNYSKVKYDQLSWTANDFKLGTLDVPSFVSLSHEFAHFLSSWYGFADLDIWYINGTDIVLNDEKWAVNVENLIRGEHKLRLRKYYSLPNKVGECGAGNVPKLDWVQNKLELIAMPK